MLKNSNELTEKAAKENNLDKTQAFRQSAESKSDNIGDASLCAQRQFASSK